MTGRARRVIGVKVSYRYRLTSKQSWKSSIVSSKHSCPLTITSDYCCICPSIFSRRCCHSASCCNYCVKVSFPSHIAVVCCSICSSSAVWTSSNFAWSIANDDCRCRPSCNSTKINPKFKVSYRSVSGLTGTGSSR